jgi:death-on-curing protein
VSEIRWILKRTIIAIHNDQLAEHGGKPAIRDEGLLDSALARPEMKASYGDTHLPLLAAAYAFGIARNHPFIDGNKRTAYVAMELILGRNGYVVTADDQDATTTFLRLAAGDMTEEDLAGWIEAHLEPGTP